MHLDTPFLKLPIRFDAKALASEVRALPPTAWVPHPSGFVGNEAVRLVTADGGPNDDMKGEMSPTENLRACDYVGEIMAELGGVWGRSRLMGLGAGGQVPLHVDSHIYWRTHLRIHIPVITNPAVIFTCGPESVHMAPGECWLFDSFRWHRVQNGSSEQRIHLVLDTVGGTRLWNLIEQAYDPNSEVKTMKPGEPSDESLLFERVNSGNIMSPWELRTHVAFLLGHATPHPKLGAVIHRLNRFMDDWAVVWAQFGPDEAGRATYRPVLQSAQQDLATLGTAEIELRNQMKLEVALAAMIFANILV